MDIVSRLEDVKQKRRKMKRLMERWEQVSKCISSPSSAILGDKVQTKRRLLYLAVLNCLTDHPRIKNVLTGCDSTVCILFCEKSSGNGHYIKLMC